MKLYGLFWVKYTRLITTKNTNTRESVYDAVFMTMSLQEFT